LVTEVYSLLLFLVELVPAPILFVYVVRRETPAFSLAALITRPVNYLKAVPDILYFPDPDLKRAVQKP
jgi:hypothetical protein